MKRKKNLMQCPILRQDLERSCVYTVVCLHNSTRTSRLIFVLFLDNEPPDFPVDMAYLNEIRKRVSLARTIDKEEHKYAELFLYIYTGFNGQNEQHHNSSLQLNCKARLGNTH